MLGEARARALLSTAETPLVGVSTVFVRTFARATGRSQTMESQMLTILFCWLFFCILVGVFAHGRRNRSGVGWFCLAFLFSPLLVGLLLLCMSTRDPWAITSGNLITGSADNRPWSPSRNRPWSGGGSARPAHSESMWDRLKAKPVTIEAAVNAEVHKLNGR
jgi:hypothetical protein